MYRSFLLDNKNAQTNPLSRNRSRNQNGIVLFPLINCYEFTEKAHFFFFFFGTIQIKKRLGENKTHAHYRKQTLKAPGESDSVSLESLPRALIRREWKCMSCIPRIFLRAPRCRILLLSAYNVTRLRIISRVLNDIYGEGWYM